MPAYQALDVAEDRSLSQTAADRLLVDTGLPRKRLDGNTRCTSAAVPVRRQQQEDDEQASPHLGIGSDCTLEVEAVEAARLSAHDHRLRMPGSLWLARAFVDMLYCQALCEPMYVRLGAADRTPA